MSEQDKKTETENDINAKPPDSINLQPVADILFNYLKDIIYNPAKASMNIAHLPPQFQNFAKGLQYFCNTVLEAKSFAKELAGGNLDCEMPSSGNEIAAPLKSLHASLKHLTWQSKQVAKGDYNQRVDFMGDFADSFNDMVKQLDERHKMTLAEQYKLEFYISRLLANSPNPILLFDTEEHLVYVSDSYLDYCGYSDIDALIGQTVPELFSGFVSDEFMGILTDMFKSAAAEKRTFTAKQKIDFKKNGLLRHYQIQVTPMTELDGGNTISAIKGSILILLDMTDIENARIEAEHASQAKSEFLARMSHEMLTPLNAIMGMNYLYNASSDSEAKDDCVKKINTASNHLLSVIHDILDMSRISAGELELVKESFTFASLIEYAAESILFQAEEKNQQFNINIDPEIPKEVISDKKRISQVLIKLLSNAVKFTPDNGVISLSAHLLPEIEIETEIETDGTDRIDRIENENEMKCVIRFSVKDNGIGISEEQQKYIFESFEQADGGVARKYGGTGLGLALSKHIVELLDGKISVESDLGIGTVVTVDIPVEKTEKTEEHDKTEQTEHIEHIEQTESKDKEADNGETFENVFKEKRMLLLEDIEINRMILVSLLEDTGIQIDEAEDGAEGVAKFEAESGRYDLILTDINMPNVDGYEAAKRIRASGLPGADTIPIIAMTANISREDIVRCLASGMNTHLGKPVDIDELMKCLKKYLNNN